MLKKVVGVFVLTLAIRSVMYIYFDQYVLLRLRLLSAFARTAPVSEAKDKAVFYWWKLVNFYNVHLPRVKMAGLDENKMYKVKELDVIDNKPLDCEGKSYSGKYLMEHGLEMPYVHEVDWGKKNDWSSRVLYLEVE